MTGFPVTIRFPMHWGEMDALGHANNTRFFTWFESARIAYFKRIGLRGETPSPVGTILKRTECEFLRPVRWPAELVAGARVTALGNTSITMEYTLALAQSPDEPLARATAVVVVVNYETGEKTPVPTHIRREIEALEDRK
jgi:acyl-CoA thioester hydrolase